MVDLMGQYRKIKDQIDKNLIDCIESGRLVNGPIVSDFCNNLSKYLDVKHVIPCANGTDALTLALKCLSLPKNSEVILPAMTYCSTAFAVIEANLKPILVDTDKLSPNISIEDLKKKINKKTKVIMPVHLYGSVANLLEIKNVIKNKYSS